MSEKIRKPDYLFEVSWEVCNKVGGIHTVIATKSVSLKRELGDRHIMVGPDLVLHESDNPSFIPDESLYQSWCTQASKEGLRVKIGRWDIESKPITILVDFSIFYSEKDQIFSKMWEDYKLDSLAGQWDYVEPALFGYAVGKTIESFIKYNITANEKVVAQFHEWMTGTGLLYLKKCIPQVASVFTTHATVLGRSLAGNNRPLYDHLTAYVPEDIAKELNITSKQSLEKITANEADAFTTVSDITANESKHLFGREVDIVTPNGFENAIIPSEKNYKEKYKNAREKLLEVASCLSGEKLPENTYVVATSGRYEFRNKGIDILIDALVKIKNENKLDRPIVAYFLIPANHYGPRKDLLQSLEKDDLCDCGSKILTHNLHDAEWDPILQRLKKAGIENKPGGKVKFIFVPSYLNGNDGIFNLPYYDLLIGCDQTVFASYYEPWGYTPLESLAFKVPTITTSLAGFGVWVKDHYKDNLQGISIIERTDTNDQQVIEELAAKITESYNYPKAEKEKLRENAFQISQIALWSSMLTYYLEAYTKALEKAEDRSELFVEIEEKPSEQFHEHITPLSNDPKWKRIIVKSTLPPSLNSISKILENIWWTWDDEIQELFESIDPELWREAGYNPFVLIEKVSLSRLEELSEDKAFLEKLDRIYTRFKEYMASANLKAPLIAYFSMEFGFHDSLRLYSGGLGILAGDYLKEASDSNTNLVAIGLLYRYGYFTQMITNTGEQQSVLDYQHFSKLPLTPIRDSRGEFKTIQIMLPGRTLFARIWLLHVGRVKMYLLDTDFKMNSDEDRVISHQLYGGDNENRLKQELLLGVGGIRALRTLGIEPDLYHSNEGHSAFIGLERIKGFMNDEQLTFAEAKEIVRTTTLFTTHTPVPAGHDHFDENVLRKYMGHYPDRLRISWEEFMALGRSNPNDWSEKFNMSYLAAQLAQEVNGVSMLHGVVTREMFSRLWPGYLPEELHIGYVTNGVHWPTWTAKEWKEVYARLFDNDFINHQLDKTKWEKIRQIDDKEIWEVKQKLRKKLINAVKDRLKENWIKRHEDPKNIISIVHTLSHDVLTIVFARRFATYKRAHLLFRDLDRLEKLVNNEERPVQFLFAGKAHPQDKAGQDLIKLIVDISKRPQFLGKILFLQNYSMNLAKLLVAGADVWMNTPTRPLEASGTSGEKGVMNGTLHLSVLDGWWVEGYIPDAGWALTNERTYDNQQYQDDLDAEVIYSIIEDEIIPAFYNRNSDGVPLEWVGYIKNTIAGVSPKFTTRRMITDYQERFYNKLFERSKELVADDFKLAKEISSWKKHVKIAWDNIELLGEKLYEKNTETIEAGQVYSGQVILDLNDIPPEHVGVELVATENFRDLISRKEFNLIRATVDKAVYELKITLDKPGTFQYGIRVFPKHPILPHRQDFAHIRWI